MRVLWAQWPHLGRRQLLRALVLLEKLVTVFEQQAKGVRSNLDEGVKVVDQVGDLGLQHGDPVGQLHVVQHRRYLWMHVRYRRRRSFSFVVCGAHTRRPPEQLTL
jgi:hypothetical protein